MRFAIVVGGQRLAQCHQLCRWVVRILIEYAICKYLVLLRADRNDNVCHSMGLHGRYPGQAQTAHLWIVLGLVVHDRERNVAERLAAYAVQVSGWIYVL